jgi:uncharacterized membrane protein
VAVLVALTTVVWLALLILAPVLPVPMAGILYALGSRICHQQPERSFHLFAAQLPVCARCAGIYAGAALGSVLTLSGSIRKRLSSVAPRMLLVVGALPMLVTVTTEWSGAWPGGNDVRAATGVWLGAAVALVVGQAAATLHYGRCVPRRPIASNRPFTHI